ncbi:MAG: response regulator [Rickettsiales bacterium]|nr:response regulator [Rickettsiales bacterium]|tara:strand:- start:51 stop:419 length:369 start_codon:yes stop_codon:yes gene_type:complete
MKVLIVDDSRATRAILKRILKPMGVTCVEAADGQKGLDTLAENPDVALALVDWNMPNMDGLQFIQAVRSDSNNDDVLLMMVTTESEIQRVSYAMDAGANEYIVKPFTQDIISQKMRLMGLDV